jgi:hypothetical protein
MRAEAIIATNQHQRDINSTALQLELTGALLITLLMRLFET